MKTVLLLLVFVALATARMNMELAKSRLPNLNTFNARKRSVANGCPSSFNCASVGGTCGAVFSNDNTTLTYTECNGQSYCTTEDEFGVAGKCVAAGAAGAACTDGDDDECLVGLVCYVEVCTKVTYTGALGATCNEIDQCTGTAQCLDGTCVATVSTGSKCSGTTGCGDASTCISGTCVAWGTQVAGANCFSTLDCAAGLACNSTGVCINPGSNQGTTCNANDNSDSGCAVNQVCACGSAGSALCIAPPTLSATLVSEIVKLVNCFYANACNNIYSCSSCSISQACTALTAETTLSDGVAVPSCFIGGPCELSSSASSVMISFFALAALLLML